MSSVFFTNLQSSTKLPAHSIDRPGVGSIRLTALLVLAAATEFLLVAVAAYFAAVLYHWSVLQSLPDAAKYIPESILISTLGLLISIRHGQYSRIQTQPRHVFLWNGASSVFLVFFF